MAGIRFFFLIPWLVTSTPLPVQWNCPVYDPASVEDCNSTQSPCPFVDGAMTFTGGKVNNWSRETSVISSPIVDISTNYPAIIGSMSQMNELDALGVLEVAKSAWDNGLGVWPQMSQSQRIKTVENFVVNLLPKREEIIKILMWEICKTRKDAEKEFDRTMDFVEATIKTLKLQSGEAFGQWSSVSGIKAKVRRGPIGVTLLLAPFNYPLNEMYAMLIPALLMGNIIVMKVPHVGGLTHILSAPAFASAFPPGTVNFITGSGKVTITPIMKEGSIDMVGFIGGAKTADILIGAHPHPHRLKVFSQLEGKNLGIVMRDADLKVAVQQCVLGALSYNGQRCTAIKLMMVHRSRIEEFLSLLKLQVEALKLGLPWDEGVDITPLPEVEKPAYLEELIRDALSRGAQVVNAEGGARYGALFKPAIVYPVTPDMRLFTEEQFGPVLPVSVFDDLSEVIHVAKHSWNGQQAAIFTSDVDGAAAPLVDALSTMVGRINLNMQCSRSPDVLPFSGRRSSAMGTMSVSEALKYFSVETVIGYKDNVVEYSDTMNAIEAKSTFLF